MSRSKGSPWPQELRSFEETSDKTYLFPTVKDHLEARKRVALEDKYRPDKSKDKSGLEVVGFLLFAIVAVLLWRDIRATAKRHSNS